MESDLLLQFITESYPIPESEAEEVNKEIPSWNQNPHSGCDPSFVEWNHISGWQPYWLLEGWTGGSFNFTIDKLPTFTVSRCTTTAQLGRLLSARFLWASCTQIFRRPTTVNDQSHRWYPALDAFFFFTTGAVGWILDVSVSRISRCNVAWSAIGEMSLDHSSLGFEVLSWRPLRIRSKLVFCYGRVTFKICKQVALHAQRLDQSCWNSWPHLLPAIGRIRNCSPKEWRQPHHSR